MKKFLVATITSILLLIGFVAGSIYYEKYKIEHIVKSDKVKTAIENMLKKIENKALTPEGKIKSYKIDYDKVEKNPMGGISIDIIINDDEELVIGTIINKYDSRERYNLGALSFSPKLHKLLYEE
ncbi:DUF1310 family protein [Gemella sanguinis]|uniref:DUF1310 family protein n=1 Tax=Gemella sanguinis TaxID=84135 RepID=UPI00352C8C19